jgi:hypothetical protein
MLSQPIKLLILIVFVWFILKKEVIKKMGNLTRGIRNNNPMNLRKTDINWDGKVPGSDESFETFKSPQYGIRAGAKVLLNYQRLHGLDTINKIINRFAPPSENDTNAYAEHVSKVLGVGLDERINVDQYLHNLVSVIIKHENGVNPYGEEIREGLALV